MSLAHATSTSSRFTGLRPCLLGVVATGKVLLQYPWLRYCPPRLNTPTPVTWEMEVLVARHQGPGPDTPVHHATGSRWDLDSVPSPLWASFCISHEGVDVHPSQGYCRDSETSMRLVGGLKEA